MREVEFKHLQQNMRTDNASASIKKGKQRVTEAALQRCSYEDLQENTQFKV